MAYPDELSDQFEAALRLLELDLKLPQGFLAKLYAEESDWAFVIKTHALIEAALTHLITAALQDFRLAELVGRLETSGATTGKLAFISKMELLPERYRRFIRRFSELRNELVHDVSNSNFTFSTYIDGLNKDQRKSFKSAFSFKTRPRPDAPQDDWEEVVLHYPRFAVFMNTFKLLVEAHGKRQEYLFDEEDEDDTLSGEGES
jgi:hypothetical protein